ncbi:hypothetical protein OPT61_g8659 [Boeremia exigua]|uniref:Uncharacterized protein n=1 Tax=Boeremia exigua TaxID=749465 RepID=A0ACC2HXB2_9PLEO|nr:hypothetical protein OPT61_g8659 [Boeremia exigua]
MGLLDLPPEIIDYILDFAGPAGLEGFVLSCKAVHTRAKLQIENHNALRRRWRHTSNQSTSRRGDTLSVLYEISRNPVIAEYIESLSLWDRRADDELIGEDADEFRGDEVSLQRIKGLLRNAEFFQNSDMDEWWSEIIEEDQATDVESIDKLYATVALLTLLPNLRTLQLPDRWHEVRSDEAAEALVPVAVAGDHHAIHRRGLRCPRGPTVSATVHGSEQHPEPLRYWSSPAAAWTRTVSMP